MREGLIKSESMLSEWKWWGLGWRRRFLSIYTSLLQDLPHFDKEKHTKYKQLTLFKFHDSTRDLSLDLLQNVN